MKMSDVEVEHFTKAYGHFKAADDISFSVVVGQVFGLLGPNGARCINSDQASDRMRDP